MKSTQYWADRYVEIRRTPEEVIRMIHPGQRVFIGSACGEPQALVRALSDYARTLTGLEVVRLMSLETTPLTMIADKSQDQSLNIRSLYLGSGRPETIARNKRFITPMNQSDIPRLFKSRKLPIHVALVQAAPPDDFGWMSLGVSVDITLAAAKVADLLIVQVNPRMPRVLGHSFVHVNEADFIVEHEEALITVPEPPESERANQIGRLIARLIDDGSTLQISPGTTGQATALALADKNDLGIHSQFVTDKVMHLFSQGVINNRYKGLNEGKLVASSAIGSSALYEFLDDNPGIEFFPSDYVNNASIIAQHHRMVSLNVVMAMDLTGQVAADALPYNHFSGITGLLDFMRGAAASEDGKAILMMMATNQSGEKSRIVPQLEDNSVVVPRGDVHYVVTEYGAVNLFGKSLQERAMAMISIAHPDFRDELFQQAKEMGLLTAERTLHESLQGVYPVELEETIEIDGETVTIRPVKPVDERRIQEHYYNLDKEDVILRFFHEKNSFIRKEVEGVSQIDYVKDLTLLALVGEFGFGKVVAVGEYLLDEAKNMAEVAFSVIKPYQGKGLGSLFITKLATQARENGIIGLMAYTSPQNQGMIRLFKTLPYQSESFFDGEMLTLSCRFDKPKE
ncbi:MAG: GNAT family N-acetyltransferase [Desulfobacterales bacterium]|nr:GNAT family N-acetyltransferase [Desulfobacterales bacterium]